MIPRAAAFLPFLVLCARAQFFGLATPGDGSALYFATPLQQKNTSQPDYGKLFRFDASGLNLQESLPYQALPPVPGGGCLLGNPYDIQFADVSSDGGVFAVTAQRQIEESDEMACEKQNSPYVTTILEPPFSQDVPDYVRLRPMGGGHLVEQGRPFSATPMATLLTSRLGRKPCWGRDYPRSTNSASLASSNFRSHPMAGRWPMMAQQCSATCTP